MLLDGSCPSLDGETGMERLLVLLLLVMAGEDNGAGVVLVVGVGWACGGGVCACGRGIVAEEPWSHKD